jgi:lipid-A-disaccharide synthase
MAGAGVKLLADLEDLAVMGLVEVAKRAPFFFRLRRQVRRFLVEQEVDLLIPIDYPGFNLPLAEFSHSRDVPVLYFIAPQVWAWRERRAQRLARACDLVCVVLPFEAELLGAYGAEVRFVGHPLLDLYLRGGAAAGSPGHDETEPGGSPDVLALFPGSRPQELEWILPTFVQAARLVRAQRPDLEIVVARAPDLAKDLYTYSTGALPLRPPEEAVARATVALTKSGTITLQLALGSVPMVVGYRMSPATFMIARRLVAVEHIALANLVAGRRLVPEFVQDRMTPEALASAVLPLLERNGEPRRKVIAGLSEVADRLGEPGCAGRVAEYALGLLGTA